MKLFAAYVNDVLIDQVSGETEDTAFAKLKMDYPELSGTVTFQVIDPNYQENKPSPEGAVMEKKDSSKVKIIEAAEVKIVINVHEGSLSKEDIEELDKASEQGFLAIKTTTKG